MDVSRTNFKKFEDHDVQFNFALNDKGFDQQIYYLQFQTANHLNKSLLFESSR